MYQSIFTNDQRVSLATTRSTLIYFSRQKIFQIPETLFPRDMNSAWMLEHNSAGSSTLKRVRNYSFIASLRSSNLKYWEFNHYLLRTSVSQSVSNIGTDVELSQSSQRENYSTGMNTSLGHPSLHRGREGDTTLDLHSNPSTILISELHWSLNCSGSKRNNTNQISLVGVT